MSLEQRPRLRLALIASIAVIAVGLRVAYASTHADWMRGDAETYDRMARQLLDGGYLGYSDHSHRSWRPPLYPSLLALVYAVTGPSILAAKVVQSCLAAAAVVVIARLGERLHSTWAGLAGALFYATLSTEIRHSTSLYPETLLALFAAMFALSTTHEQTPRRGLYQGLLAGLMCLMQPGIALLPVLFGGALVVFRKDPRRKLATAMMLGALGVTLTPWAIRNTLLHDRFVLISTNGGFNLYKGNNPHTDVPPTSAMQPHLNAVGAAMPGGSSEVEKDKLWRKAATDWIKANPGAYAKLAARRAFAWVVPSEMIEHPTGWLITYGTMFPFLLVGGFVLVRRRDVTAIGPVLILVATLAPTVIAVYADARYRRPAMAVSAAIAGCGVAAAVGAARAKLVSRGDAAAHGDGPGPIDSSSPPPN